MTKKRVQIYKLDLIEECFGEKRYPYSPLSGCKKWGVGGGKQSKAKPGNIKYKTPIKTFFISYCISYCILQGPLLSQTDECKFKVHTDLQDLATNHK